MGVFELLTKGRVGGVVNRDRGRRVRQGKCGSRYANMEAKW
jgi:hypothetical protein